MQTYKFWQYFALTPTWPPETPAPCAHKLTLYAFLYDKCHVRLRAFKRKKRNRTKNSESNLNTKQIRLLSGASRIRSRANTNFLLILNVIFIYCPINCCIKSLGFTLLFSTLLLRKYSLMHTYTHTHIFTHTCIN